MRIPFYNVSIDIDTEESVLDTCKNLFESREQKTICFLNAHCFNVAQKNLKYRDSLSRFSLILNDGIGISIAGKIKGIKFKENLNGTDLIPKIIDISYKSQKKIYLLGTSNSVLDKAEAELSKKFHGITIIGKHHGFFTEIENNLILKEINEKNVEVVIVGMGVPQQELWIQNNIEFLPNVQLFVAGGAIIDFMSGTIKRAPIFFRKLRLEWMFRLLIEPRRMWKRYLVGNFVFLCSILKLKKN